MISSPAVPYQYLVLKCVPRADRLECMNLGVVLYCQRLDFLSCTSHVDGLRIRSLDPGLDLDAVSEALARIAAVCRGEDRAGLAATLSLGERFGHLAAPRSTVVRPGPIHGGLLTSEASDPAELLHHLLATLVLLPAPPGGSDPARG